MEKTRAKRGKSSTTSVAGKRSVTKRLSDQQLDVLDTLAGFVGWARPMDIGARDGSHHSETLNGLAKRHLVEREKLHAIYCCNGSTHPPDAACRCKGSCRYRITQAGRKAVRP